MRLSDYSARYEYFLRFLPTLIFIEWWRDVIVEIILRKKKWSRKNNIRFHSMRFSYTKLYSSILVEYTRITLEMMEKNRSELMIAKTSHHSHIDECAKLFSHHILRTSCKQKCHMTSTSSSSTMIAIAATQKVTTTGNMRFWWV